MICGLCLKGITPADGMDLIPIPKPFTGEAVLNELFRMPPVATNLKLIIFAKLSENLTY
jgi:hypothetical protein